jgi:hypothetical protein
MTNEVLFVSETKLKAFTSINANVSPSVLIPYVYDSQNIDLINLLGTRLQNELKLQIRTGTLTDDNAYLLNNFIGNVVLNYALYRALPWIHMRILNKGVMTMKSESGDPVKMEEIQWLQKEQKNIADMYAFIMQKYLYGNMNLYPAWSQSNALSGIVADRSSPFTSALVVPSAPYAFRKRLMQNRQNGNYMYNIAGDTPSGGTATTWCDFPYWLYPGN